MRLLFAAILMASSSAVAAETHSTWFLQVGGAVGAETSVSDANNNLEANGSSSGGIFGSVTLALGWRRGPLELGILGELGGTYNILAVNENFVGAGLFAGIYFRITDRIGFELLARGGVHHYSSFGTDGAALPFVGLGPQVHFRFGDGRAAFLLTVGTFVEVDLQQKTFPMGEGSGGPTSLTLGGVMFGTGPSIGLTFE
jgi:hypothetical protein